MERKETERMDRIREMEGRLNRLAAWTRAGEGIREDVRALEAYYGTDQWRQDLEADEKGKLPLELARGVLSEDGIWNALEAYRELAALEQEVPEEAPYVLKSARYQAAEILRKAVRGGDTVVDATMGNGHDTLFLCSLVGETGKVYAFDIQQEAVDAAAKRLREAGVENRAELFRLGHEHIAEKVPGPVQAVVFNLGWLPGGDHSVTTRTETTMTAAGQALELLAPGGVLVMCVYPGHAEGARELERLTVFFAELEPRRFNVLRQSFPNAGEGAPVCFTAQKQ